MQHLSTRFFFPLFSLFLFATGSISSQNLQRVGHLAYSPTTLAGCWHHVDKNGGEWALVGTYQGLSIVDLRVPTDPVERFSVPGPINNWREVKTWAGYAYVGSEALGSGITIVNLNHLPDSIDWKVWRGDGVFDSLVMRSHAVQAEAGFLYIFGGGVVTNGATIASLADPWNPSIVGTYTQNYVHDGYIRGDTLWTSEIYAGQFGVVDISDRKNPVLLATQQTPGLFNHNSWLSDNGKTLFTTDEVIRGHLAAFDVSQIDDIRLIDRYLPSKKPQGEPHNVRVAKGDYLICPSYRGQLTIVDASQPDNLLEIAWDSLGNSLVWDADPYLPSGLIIATAKQEGLFVYKPNYVRAAHLQGLVFDATTGQPIPGAKVFVLNTANADTTGANGIYKTGAGTAGTYSIRAQCTGYYTQTAFNVSLQSGSNASVNFALVPDALAASDLEIDRGVRVSPTPFSNFLQIEILADSPFADPATVLRLFDVAGKLILEKKIEIPQRTTLQDLGHLPAGNYLLQLQSAGGEQITLKLLK